MTRHNVAALRGGEESSFRDLVKRYHLGLVRLARVTVGSQAAAEQVANNTCRVVIRDIGGFDGRSSLKVWIFAIALNEARSWRARSTGSRYRLTGTGIARAAATRAAARFCVARPFQFRHRKFVYPRGAVFGEGTLELRPTGDAPQ
jgi:DNA-directed RNA polymerase specialized sigma24 family protein